MVGGVAALEQVQLLLRAFKFRYGSELDLQDGIAEALTRREVAFEREKTLSASDRPDFLVPCIDGELAIEVKIKGSFNDMLRQIARYAAHDRVRGILVIGSPVWVSRTPESIAGTPVRSIRLMANLF